MLTAGPKGANDILPVDINRWHYLEAEIRKICREYGFSEIRTPVFEHTELFARGVGGTTDVVEKEMYTFEDKGGRSVSLRPEGTASVVRAFVEHKIYAQPQPTKVYYLGPMFRYANVQAGRYRQFHQFGVEVLGSGDPLTDAEVITMAMDFYRRIGLKNLELHINSVGCPRCRPVYREKLREFLAPGIDNLCGLCRSRIDRNPLRILDCKEAKCRELSENAPVITDCLCGECAENFAAVRKYLDSVRITYVVDPRLVRGLDYYTGTAFEVMASDIGAQSSIGGGGRYDGLISEVGGPSMPGIGFALGMERIMAAMERQGLAFPAERKFDVYVAALGDKARRRAFKMVYGFRRAGLVTEMDLLGRSLKAQMKQADRLGARFVLILGEDELAKKVTVVRDMSSGRQREVPLKDVQKLLVEKCQKTRGKSV